MGRWRDYMIGLMALRRGNDCLDGFEMIDGGEDDAFVYTRRFSFYLFPFSLARGSFFFLFLRFTIYVFGVIIFYSAWVLVFLFPFYAFTHLRTLGVTAISFFNERLI